MNPIHNLAKAVRSSTQAPTAFEESDKLPDNFGDVVFLDEPWTIKDVEEVVEIALTEYEIKSWQDLIELELLTEAPHELIDRYLQSINKNHLRRS